MKRWLQGAIIIKQRNHIFFLLAACLFMGDVMLFSQPPTSPVLKGNVTTEDGKPADYITIQLSASKLRTVTDGKGGFSLTTASEFPDTLLIEDIRFLPYKQLVYPIHNQTLDIGTIVLKYNIGSLQQVEIIGRIGQSYKSDYSFATTKIQTASKDIPQSVSTITKELIRDKMAIRLYDLLDNAAGVNHYSGYNEYTIRGFRAENPNLINGLRTFNSLLASPMLVNMERIEIVKGPVSVLYGNADPGGTINLVTKKPLQKKECWFDIYQGSWSNLRTQTDITGPLNKSKTMLYRFNGGIENTNSFRSQMFSKSFQLAPSFSFVPNTKLQLNLDVSLSRNNTLADRGQPGLGNDIALNATSRSLMVNQPGDFLKETNIASIFSVSYKFSKHISFNSAWLNYITRQKMAEHGLNDYITDDSIYLNYTNRYVNTITNNLTNYITFQFKTGKFTHQLLLGYDFIKSSVAKGQWKGELADEFGDGSSVVGALSLLRPAYFKRKVDNYDHAAVDDDETDDIDADEYYTHGIYLQEQLGLGKWQLLASLRGEFYTGTGDDFFKQRVFLPRVGITYNFSPDLHFYATYNMGFDPFEMSNAFQVFNAPFKPIYSQMYEVGAKAGLFKNRLSATLAFYQVTLKNVAVNANDPTSPDLFVQRGQERARGFEAEANGNLLPNLSMSVSYACNVAKITKSDIADEIGNIKENAPRHVSGSRFKYIFQKGFLNGLGMSLGHSQAGQRNTLDKDIVLPGYCIVNAGLQYTRSRITIALNLNNIANKSYWTAAYNNTSKWPGIPRNYMVRIGYSL